MKNKNKIIMAAIATVLLSTQSYGLDQVPHINYDVRRISSVKAEDLNRVFSGKLAGRGSVFIEAGNRYGVDPLFLAGIAMHESWNGKSKAINYKNNAMGIFASGGVDMRKFETVEESIFESAKIISKGKYYYNDGRFTLGLIQERYCPVGAKNDPNKLNKNWRRGVIGYMIEVYKNLN